MSDLTKYAATNHETSDVFYTNATNDLTKKCAAISDVEFDGDFLEYNDNHIHPIAFFLNSPTIDPVDSPSKVERAK
jgi:hypothetical protein